jgi:hypothetical protein
MGDARDQPAFEEAMDASSQLVLDLPLAARVLDRREPGDQGFGHGLPPSGKAEP